MSLLEDIFLEDEAGEAQDLERVIEGDEFEERRRSDDDDDDNEGNNRDDEAEEDKRRVDPTAPKSVRVVKNPRFVLNPARLTGPRGIHVIPEHFKDFKFKGKGHEKEDLDLMLKKLEHWTYRLYPKFKFADCLKKIEALGKKRPVMVHLHKIRSDQFQSEETVVQQDSSDDETPTAAPPVEDEFDKLLQQQIDISRTMTPAPGSVRKGFNTPGDISTPFAMPKATSSPSISDEQKERMIRNRRLAEERRLARLKQNSSENLNATNGGTQITNVDLANSNEVNKENVTPTKRKHSNDNVINNSIDLTEIDKENDVTTSKRLIMDVDVTATTNTKNDINDVSPSRTLISKESNVLVSEIVDLTDVNASERQGNVDSNLNISSKKTSHRVNIIDSSDEDSEVVAVNTSNKVGDHRKNRANDNEVLERTEVMDSSDDEQDSRIVNQSVIVDIHNTDNGNNNTSKADSKSDNDVDKNTNLNTVNNYDDVTEIQSVPAKESNDVESEVDIGMKTDAIDNEIMDVDFGDF